MSLSHPLLSPLPPFPRTSTTPAWLAMPLHCHVKLVCVIKWSQVKRLEKLLEFGQNASESIPYFHEYTIWLEITLTLVGFWLAKRGIERFLEKRGCRNYFRPISKPRWSRFLWVSKSLFFFGRGGGWFLRLSLEFYFIINIIFFFCLRVSDPRICHFFFPFGLQKSNFSEFIGTAYQKGLVDLDRKTRQSSILVDVC